MKTRLAGFLVLAITLGGCITGRWVPPEVDPGPTMALLRFQCAEERFQPQADSLRRAIETDLLSHSKDLEFELLTRDDETIEQIMAEFDFGAAGYTVSGTTQLGRMESAHSFFGGYIELVEVTLSEPKPVMVSDRDTHERVPKLDGAGNQVVRQTKTVTARVTAYVIEVASTTKIWQGGFPRNSDIFDKQSVSQTREYGEGTEPNFRTDEAMLSEFIEELGIQIARCFYIHEEYDFGG